MGATVGIGCNRSEGRRARAIAGWGRLGRGAALSVSAVLLLSGCAALNPTGPTEKAPEDLSLQTPLKELRKWAHADNPKAQYLLGGRFEKAQGLPRNPEKAVTWYRRAARQGHTPAQVRLGAMYQTGQGLNTNAEGALEWYRKAAQEGSVVAQTNVGILYARGIGSIDQDFDKAAKWLKQAAEQGDPPAQFNLGLLYAAGKGVKPDGPKAMAWWEKAAEQGYARAQRFLEKQKADSGSSFYSQ